MSYSTDFREQVLRFVELGGKIKEACQLFSISHCSINRWKNTKKATGTVGRKPRPKAPYKINDDELKKFIKQHPDAYLNEIAAHFNVTYSGISKALSRLKITRKKSRRSIQKEMK